MEQISDVWTIDNRCSQARRVPGSGALKRTGEPTGPAPRSGHGRNCTHEAGLPEGPLHRVGGRTLLWARERVTSPQGSFA